MATAKSCTTCGCIDCNCRYDSRWGKQEETFKGVIQQQDVKQLPHYTKFKMQPIEFFRANKDIIGFIEMCVIKYVCRYKFKNGREDLLKARNYLDMAIEEWDKDHPAATCTVSTNYSLCTSCRKEKVPVGCTTCLGCTARLK